MADLTCKLLVIGAGPGGYVCAIRAAQHGVDTILAESGELGRDLPERQLHSI